MGVSSSKYELSSIARDTEFVKHLYMEERERNEKKLIDAQRDVIMAEREANDARKKEIRNMQELIGAQRKLIDAKEHLVKVEKELQDYVKLKIESTRAKQ